MNLSDSSDESENSTLLAVKLAARRKNPRPTLDSNFSIDSSTSEDSSDIMPSPTPHTIKKNSIKTSRVSEGLRKTDICQDSTPEFSSTASTARLREPMTARENTTTHSTHEQSRQGNQNSVLYTSTATPSNFSGSSTRNPPVVHQPTPDQDLTDTLADEHLPCSTAPNTLSIERSEPTSVETDPLLTIDPTPASQWFDVDEPSPEVCPESYIPPNHDRTGEPRLYYFNENNRPKASRKRIEVAAIFKPPVADLWKNKFKNFNHLQSEMANMIAFSDDNVVVSAPTGSGKTAIFEMAIARFLDADLRVNKQNQVTKARKIVYISPSKALCEERYYDWSNRLQKMNLGIEIAVVTGDGDPSAAYHDFAFSHIILTTPEKLDSLTRRWTENFFLLGSIKLILVDEIHLLGEPGRGACLEAVLCRIKSINRATGNAQLSQSMILGSSYSSTSVEALQTPTRVVAVSATLPNIGEIAHFLDANEAHVFDSSYRPVVLNTHVLGMGYIGNRNNSDFLFWRNFDQEIPGIIHRFSNGRPTIIFCHSKKDTENLADSLSTIPEIAQLNSSHELAQKARLPRLQRVLFNGIAFHHAGISFDDRRTVEKAFSSGKVRVLCATSTLAVGVNLPAHLVVIKGTRAYRGSSGFQEIDQASLLQMIGRAGRPGFDTSGTAVIMTDNESKDYYERLIANGLKPAKSQLASKLTEIMNTEISQRVVTSTETAINWFRSTLYYVQAKRSQNQSFPIERHFVELSTREIERLLAAKLIQKEGPSLSPTQGGHVMSQHLVNLQAMQLLADLSNNIDQVSLLRTIASIEDIQRPARRSEKKMLNELQKSIKYRLDGPPSKARVKEPWQKTFVLLQSWIEEKGINDFTMQQETTAFVEYAQRILTALEEYCARHTKNGRVLAQAMYLRRALKRKSWGSNRGSLTSLSCVGRETGLALQLAGLSSFEDVLLRGNDEIETAARRSAPFGSQLRATITRILESSLCIKARIQYAEGSTRPAAVLCSINPRLSKSALSIQTREHMSIGDCSYTLLIYSDEMGKCLLYKKNIMSACSFNIPYPRNGAQVHLLLVANESAIDDTLRLRPDNSTREESDFFSEQKKAITPSPTVVKQNLPVRGSSTYFFPGATEGNEVVTEASPRQQPVAFPPTQSMTVPRSNHPRPAVQQSVPQSIARSTKESTVRNDTSAFQTPKQRVALGNRPVITGSDHQLERQRPPRSAVSTVSKVSRHQNTGPINRVEKNAASQNAWNRSRRQHQRAQQRAFSNKSENPFSNYAHDPNDAESILDGLFDKQDVPSTISTVHRQVDQRMGNQTSRFSSGQGSRKRGKKRHFPQSNFPRTRQDIGTNDESSFAASVFTRHGRIPMPVDHGSSMFAFPNAMYAPRPSVEPYQRARNQESASYNRRHDTIMTELQGEQPYDNGPFYFGGEEQDSLPRAFAPTGRDDVSELGDPLGESGPSSFDDIFTF